MRRLAIVLALVALIVGAGGCAESSFRSVRRTVELDASADVAFRAAAATLLDDRKIFDLSDRDAGLVVGLSSTAEYSYSGRTTFWVTPMDDDRSFVLVQTLYYGGQAPESLGAGLDAMITRLRQRCLREGDVRPMDAGAGADTATTPEPSP